ncbi:MAG TPA: hypothetical protein VNG12_12935 [Acidimicrobiales bacterium]|nr:hypothetical protein [Acidimicrobiales bacterium]
MRSLPGYSGSPVVLYWEKTAVMSWTVHATPDSIIGQRGVMDRSWLLGIDWGHPGRTQPVLDADGNPVPQGLRVRTNTGLSAVVPAWKLATLLELPELVASRHEAETTYAQQPDGAVPDS